MKKIYIISGVLFISLLTIYILFNTSIIQPHPPSKENKRATNEYYFLRIEG